MCQSNAPFYRCTVGCAAVVAWLIIGLAVANVGIASDWPVSRGNATSTGVAEGQLPASPELLWEYKTESDKSGFEGTPIVYDGKVFLGDFEGTVHAIDLATGKGVWAVKKKDGFVTAAAAQDGKLILGDFSGMVFCLDAKTGEQLWTRDIEQQIANGPNFYGDDVLVASEGGTMFALDLKTGEAKWSYTTGDQLRSSPTVWKSFSLLGGCDGKLHKIDLARGEKVGEGVTLDAPTLSTPNIIGRMAIVPTQPGVVLAIDVETEKVVWSYSDASQSSDIRASPASLGQFENEKLSGIAVVATRNKRLLGLDLANGKVLWESILKKRADSSPIICSDRAWIGALDGSLYAIDLKSGEETWSYQLSGQILASPAVAQGKLIIATEKGSVLCFGAK